MTQQGSRFRREMEIIPMGWVIAAVVAFAVVQVAFLVLIPHYVHDSVPPQPWLGLIGLACSIFSAASFLLVGYVYADAKRRGMNALLWVLLALFLPKPIGFIAYFLLRKPLIVPCPNCQNPVGGDYVFCGKCGYALQPTCGGCGRQIQRDFVCCPYCGKTAGAPPTLSPAH